MATALQNLSNYGSGAAAKLTAVGERPLSNFINRDLSLLEFFKSVLHEGLDESLPLLERLKFIAIFGSNLDEFFMIRVSSLKQRLGTKIEVSTDGFSGPELLTEIRSRVLKMTAKQSKCLTDSLIPDLSREGVVLDSYKRLASEDRARLDMYFDEHIMPVITPQAVDPTHPFPYISGSSLSIGLYIKPVLSKRVARSFAKIGDEFFVRIEIPSFLPRFVPVGGGDETRFVPIEEIVTANIAKIAPDAAPDRCHIFRITRDGDLDLRESEARDILETMEENLKERRFGDVVRLEVARSMPEQMVRHLTECLKIEQDDVYSVDGLMKISDLWSIVNLNRPDLKEPSIRPEPFDRLSPDGSIFELIGREDILLHHPYQPYSTVTDMIAEAADDPDVLAIKMCLYRIGEDSPIAPLLIKASENGKQVTALIEIKARFDEANNIEWGKRLEEAGVHVVYGLLGLKTHAKTTLIVRREGEKLRRYVHLATGNYNPATSTIYTDLGLLTADEEIGADVADLFNYLTVYTEPKKVRKVLIAPIDLRERMLALIERETENARAGKRARMIAKINRLADTEIVNKLYEASQAGVEIDLIVRGICTLRPGVSGMSENIRVRSIVGRLLEHSRVYYFENGGDPEVFIGSSDWMPRNLDRRVEVLAPITDRRIAAYLSEKYLPIYLQDNAKARLLQQDGSYVRPEQNGERVDAQLHFRSRSSMHEFPIRN
ncbi:MAG: polyphosphate kinase 1 [Chloracidobacterium sp.]|nr:polyphosphate kinase 1 [Chloracidobacterium sp.]